MPRPLSWLPRLHVIRRTVANSVRSHYDRRELETLFELQPDRPGAETSGEQERQLCACSSVLHAQQHSAMRPAQFVTQCVTDRKGLVEETHVASKPFPNSDAKEVASACDRRLVVWSQG